MNNAELPTSVIGLLAFAIATLGGIWRIRVGQAQQGRQVREQGKQVKEVHAQIQNDHPHRPNMRDEMDEMAKMIRSGFQNLRGDIRGIHKDISGLHGTVAGVRRELHNEIDRSTAADSRLGNQINEIRNKNPE